MLPLKLTWGKGLKKEVWPKYQGENLETKGESSSSGLPSKPGLAGCSERFPRARGHICVPESDLGQGQVCLELQLKGGHGGLQAAHLLHRGRDQGDRQGGQGGGGRRRRGVYGGQGVQGAPDV